jgi:hypothetical protein
MSEINSTVGEYESHDAAVEAVKRLNKGGYPMNKVSIIGKELERIEDIKGYYTCTDAAKTGAGIASFWGALFGILVGVGFIVVPGIGGVFVAGSLAATLLGGIEGAALGALGGSIFGGLLGLGVGRDKMLKYQESLKAGKYLVIAHGTKVEAKRAHEILTGAPVGSVTVNASA